METESGRQKWRRKSEESVTALRREWPAVTNAVDRPSENVVGDLPRRAPWEWG